MQTTKGRIVEIQKNSIILLTAQGEFIQRPLPKGGLQLGDQITVPVHSFKTPLGSLASLASAAAVVAFLLFQSIVTMAAPAYYVHFDIEPGTPSIELALSKNMRVVRATPLNNEGGKILNETEIKHKTAAGAIESLVDTAEDLNYLSHKEENTVLISVTGANKEIENNNNRYKRELTKEVQAAARTQLKTGKTTTTLGVATMDNEARKQALNKKGSINSMLLKKQTKGSNNIPKEYEVSKVTPAQDKKAAKTKQKDNQESQYTNTNSNHSNSNGNQSNGKDETFQLPPETDKASGNKGASSGKNR